MSKCKSCGAEIIWIKTRNGKNMPCDAEPVYYLPDPDGKEVIVTSGGTVTHGFLSDMRIAETGYRSHFATCPNANQHRRR